MRCAWCVLSQGHPLLAKQAYEQLLETENVPPSLRAKIVQQLGMAALTPCHLHCAYCRCRNKGSAKTSLVPEIISQWSTIAGCSSSH